MGRRVSRPLRSWGNQYDAELVDLTYVLDQQSTQALGWGRNTLITNIIFAILGRAAFTLDDVAVVGEEAKRNLAEPMVWQPGTTWLQMLTDLGNIVGFAAPWFDRNGLIHHDQPPDPDIAIPTVPSYDSAPRIVADSIVPSDDLLSAPNDFAVFDSGTDRLRVGRYQLPAGAPHSLRQPRVPPGSHRKRAGVGDPGAGQ